MKISYINGVCVRNDAISNSIRDEINWLMAEGCHDLRFFAYACDHGDLPFVQVHTLRDIAFNRHFQTSDMVVFHFGVFYPLFDILPVVPRKAKKIVVFHNITPKEFLPAASHELIDRSFAQLCNLSFADHVVCVSDTNQKVLDRLGLHKPTTILPLALHSSLQAPSRKPSFDDGITRIAFIGRFVTSKGPVELLEALVSLLELEKGLRLILNLVGNLTFSDENVIAEVKARILSLQTQYGDRVEASLHGNALEADKCRLLAEADIFVLPTRHEGFCVPILEALEAGCRVVTYDNSNTPAISGGLADLVPTGDVSVLTSTLVNSVRITRSISWIDEGGYTRSVEAAAAHLRQFQPDIVKRRFLKFIERQG